MDVLAYLQALLAGSLVAGTPLLLGTVGSILTERAGVLNLGVEGMMALGAVAAFIATSLSGSPLAGILAGATAGAALASVHALLSVKLRANQTVSGLAIAMIGTGAASLLGKPYIGRGLEARAPVMDLPFLSGIPGVGVFFSLDLFFYIALAAVACAWFFLRHTRKGIELRTVGENPRAAEALGINVQGIRMAATVAGGALIGVAGAELPLAYTSTWIEGVSGGRGWIVVALTIFSLWNPLRACFGAFLYGLIFILQFRLQGFGIPSNLLAALPFILTLLVLVIDGLRKDKRKLGAPAALGEAFKKGDR